jgi:hypothetical protein
MMQIHDTTSKNIIVITKLTQVAYRLDQAKRLNFSVGAGISWLSCCSSERAG